MRRLPYLPLLCLLLSGAFGTAAEPFHYPVGRCGTGELKYVNGVPVLTVEGSPEQIGEAVGVLAMRPGQRMASYADDLLEHYHASIARPSFLIAGRKMVERFPDDYRREFEALVRASSVERDQAVLGNTLFDLKKLIACSALLVEPSRSASGAPLLGRNLDYPSLGYAQEYSLVTIYRPAGKHAFASVGFPGLVGCLSGMNDAGLAVAILEVFHIKAGHFWFNHAGQPYALCYRRILEECTTAAEAKDLLESMKRTTTTNLVIADRAGVAVLEVTPHEVVLRRASDGTCTCTNHFCTKELQPLVHYNSYRTYDRFQQMEETIPANQRLGLDDVHRALAAALQEVETMQTMIFEPATLRLHLCIGVCPSTAGEMKLLELGPLLHDPAAHQPETQAP